jgi:16S rRNA processing protein RimM
LAGDGILTVGRILAPFGIKGWVKVFSETDPKENLLAYQPWRLRRQDRWEEVEVAESALHGKGLVVRLRGVNDRNGAEALAGLDIGVPEASLPAPEAGSYYWKDLVGLAVVNTGGVLLGRVERLFETGANDVMVVKPCPGSVDDEERLLPWVQGAVVKNVDMAAGTLTVDWEQDY